VELVLQDDDDTVLDRGGGRFRQAVGQDGELDPAARVGPDPSRERRDVVQGARLGPDVYAPQAMPEGPLPARGERAAKVLSPRLVLGDPEQADDALGPHAVRVRTAGAVVEREPRPVSVRPGLDRGRALRDRSGD